MRGRDVIAAAVLLATLAGQAAAAERACDVKVNVTDTDPAGLNVRAAPGGAVLGALKTRGMWVQVHAVGQDGEWIRIDGAVLFDDSVPNGETAIRPGHGWVHVSKLGIESFQAQATILAAPAPGAKVLANVGADPDSGPTPQFLACSGDWLQVRWNGVVGWTQGYCSNQRTTCS
jgi:hypothetical protein